MTNSIYTTKQIFLRELVSNCSDSLSKLQHVTATESLSDFTESELRIDIDINKDEKTLTIKDNGIGMTAGDLESNLGTIAKSGSADFKATEDSGDVIGKFGVGFYSAFMVGDHVTVKSRSVKGGGDAAAGDAAGDSATTGDTAAGDAAGDSAATGDSAADVRAAGTRRDDGVVLLWV